MSTKLVLLVRSSMVYTSRNFIKFCKLNHKFLTIQISNRKSSVFYEHVDISHPKLRILFQNNVKVFTIFDLEMTDK